MSITTLPLQLSLSLPANLFKKSNMVKSESEEGGRKELGDTLNGKLRDGRACREASVGDWRTHSRWDVEFNRLSARRTWNDCQGGKEKRRFLWEGRQEWKKTNDFHLLKRGHWLIKMRKRFLYQRGGERRWFTMLESEAYSSWRINACYSKWDQMPEKRETEKSWWSCQLEHLICCPFISNQPSLTVINGERDENATLPVKSLVYSSSNRWCGSLFPSSFNLQKK